MRIVLENTLKQELSIAETFKHNLLFERSVVDGHECHMAAKFSVFVGDEDHSKFLRYTGYINFITDHVSHIFANTSSCPTTELSILLTSCPFTAFKSHFIKYCESVIKWNSYYLFWSIKNSGAILESSLYL